MAVRGFNGSSDILNCGTGAASGVTYGTVAALVRYTTSAVFQAIAHLHDSAGTFGSSMLNITPGGMLAWYAGTESNTGATVLSTGTWYLLVARKATGTATPRFSFYNYTSTSWTHVAGSTSLGNHTAPGASGTIRFNFQDTDDWFGSYVAVRAVWSNTLPWTADASGDTALQGAGLQTAAANWLSASPSAMWRFNQTSTATAVTDDTGGGAGQTSITGTTVVTGDDPPGFNFDITSQPVAVQAAGPFPAF